MSKIPPGGDGPPWRDSPGVRCCRCNIQEAGLVKIRTWKVGLDQGIMGDLVLSDVKERKRDRGLLAKFRIQKPCDGGNLYNI